MTDQEFATNMQVDNEGNMPSFYDTYVSEVCDKVENKASDEFRYVHETALRTGVRRTAVTDQLSQAMNDLTDMVDGSPIYDNAQIRDKVLSEAIPTSLQNLLGFNTVVERVPEPHLRATFAMHLASQYVYTHGSEPNPYQFYEFMKTYE